MTDNRHRWRNSLDDRKVTILKELRAELQLAWAVDSERPKSFPLVANEVLAEIKRKLAGYTPPKRTRTKLPPAARAPKTFADLFDDGMIRAVYEDQYSDSYDEALQRVGSANRGWGKALHKLLKTAETSYTIGIGCEIPAPRTHFLHRQLFDIAQILGIDDLTNRGVQEFFEDLCPCGKNTQRRNPKEAEKAGREKEVTNVRKPLLCRVSSLQIVRSSKDSDAEGTLVTRRYSLAQGTGDLEKLPFRDGSTQIYVAGVRCTQ